VKSITGLSFHAKGAKEKFVWGIPTSPNCHPEPCLPAGRRITAQRSCDVAVWDLMVFDINKACINNQISREVKMMKAHVQF
jgi:hypothetical protein